MESASADDVRARGSPKGLVLAPLQAQAQHYPKGEGWKRSQFGSRKRSQTDRQTDAPTDNDHFNRVWTSTTLLRNNLRTTFRSDQRSAIKLKRLLKSTEAIILAQHYIFKSHATARFCTHHSPAACIGEHGIRHM